MDWDYIEIPCSLPNLVYVSTCSFDLPQGDGHCKGASIFTYLCTSFSHLSLLHFLSSSSPFTLAFPHLSPLFSLLHYPPFNSIQLCSQLHSGNKRNQEVGSHVYGQKIYSYTVHQNIYASCRNGHLSKYSQSVLPCHLAGHHVSQKHTHISV